jgi:hypothetical protein
MSAHTVLEAKVSLMNTFSQPCQIMVLSEDAQTYGRAMYVCQHVLAQFAEKLDFNFHCWNFRQQGDLLSVRQSVDLAARADIILLSVSGIHLGETLHEWLQAFSENRSRTQGTLALVFGPDAGPWASLQKLADLIQDFTEAAGLDFVPLMPENRTSILPSPPRHPTHGRDYPQYADRPNYDHWGLNE